MNILINGKVYELLFEHHVKGLLPGTQGCRAQLKGGEPGKSVYWTEAEAYSLCAPEDQYDKFLGRKLALQRLLKHFPREVRREVWQQYWTATNRPLFAGIKDA